MVDCTSCNHDVTVEKNRNRTIKVTLQTNGDPFDITGAKVWFSVKGELEDADTDALIEKKNFAAGGADTEASVIDGAAGILEIYILPEDTKLMEAGDYWYDVVIETTDPKKLQAVNPSRFSVLQPVTVT